jgi:hypothetical protein
MKSSPILFIHYGRENYLKYTLSAARASNPDKNVILIGDAHNRDCVPAGIGFEEIADYTFGHDLGEFHSRFVPIAGSNHRFTKCGGTDTWLRFVFARWFILKNFAESRGLNEFWTFDSDTLVTTPLASEENRFRSFDATEQCGGRCLNGFIHSTDLIRSYCKEIITVFGNADLLEKQRARLRQHSGLAFNEMDVWQYHRDRLGLKTVRLGYPYEGEAFDDALAIHSGWKKAPVQVRDHIPVKYLERDARGGFFAFHGVDGSPVRLMTLNLSWLPDYVFRLLLPGCGSGPRFPYDNSFTRIVDFSEPLFKKYARRSLQKYWSLHARFARKKTQ